MSIKYKKEMNKISVSDKLKKKVLLEINNRHISDNKETKTVIENNRYSRKRSKMNPFVIKVVPSVALSIMIIIIASIFIKQNVNDPNQPNVGPNNNNSTSIMRAVGEIKQLSSDEKGDYIIVTVGDNDIKFYYDEKTKLYYQEKPSDKTLLKVGHNVEILYAGISSQPQKEYLANRIVSNYVENIQVQDTNVQYDDLDSAKKDLGRDIMVPQAVPEGYKFDYINVISNETLEIGYYNNRDFIIFAETVGEDYKGNIIVNHKYTDTIERDYVRYEIKGKDDKIYHVQWSDNKRYLSITFQDGVTEEQMLEMIESITSY